MIALLIENGTRLNRARSIVEELSPEQQQDLLAAMERLTNQPEKGKLGRRKKEKPVDKKHRKKQTTGKKTRKSKSQ